MKRNEYLYAILITAFFWASPAWAQDAPPPDWNAWLLALAAASASFLTALLKYLYDRFAGALPEWVAMFLPFILGGLLQFLEGLEIPEGTLAAIIVGAVATALRQIVVKGFRALQKLFQGDTPEAATPVGGSVR